MKAINKNKSIKAYNTFGVECFTEYFTRVNTEEELREMLLKKSFTKKFILGGGSNLLFTKNILGLCIQIDLRGISVVDENEDNVILEVQAGENWHEFVVWTIDKGYGGLENLSLIPGNTGTAPIQNIGAYGVELKDSFVSCKAMDVKSAEIREFNLQDAAFGYRTSVFKTTLKGKYVIISVQFQLTKKKHKLKTSYGAIQEELGSKTVTPKSISEAVISIRERKLPDPKVIGNSGSFFKNPIIKEEEFKILLKKYPNLPFYETDNSEVKIPAGWLIESLGYKGYKKGDAGVHKDQALVLVNHGNASGHEILELSQELQKKVKETFNIDLEIEVNIY
ncbi:MAG: UDP-N-acetylenolpyruvoylglucosamine reductase [Flavobacteriales bacterium]|nr:UDP-N-acetylenolpyruvoylglucosamine reductase [Candidatus Arcticimaribacter sp.]